VHEEIKEIQLKKVGVRDLQHPISFESGGWILNSTIGYFSMYVKGISKRGVHMSRFVRALPQTFSISSKNLVNFSNTLKSLHQLPIVVKIRFSNFILTTTPKTKLATFIPVHGEIVCDTQSEDLVYGISVNGSTVCPCAAIMGNGHQQRARVEVFLRILYNVEFDWLTLIEIARSSLSGKTYELLRRDDEKIVVKDAFKNPRFVEDVCRRVYMSLFEKKNHLKFQDFSIIVESYESIHNHNAIAIFDSGKRLKDF